MLQLEQLHFDTPISESDAGQHCNHHSQSTVLEQVQESDATNLGSYCREVLLKLYVLLLAIARVWFNHAVLMSVSLIPRHQSTMFLYGSVQQWIRGLDNDENKFE